jgi:hypothetical protein
MRGLVHRIRREIHRRLFDAPSKTTVVVRAAGRPASTSRADHGLLARANNDSVGARNAAKAFASRAACRLLSHARFLQEAEVRS